MLMSWINIFFFLGEELGAQSLAYLHVRIGKIDRGLTQLT